MKLQAKFALYNAATKIAIILVLGTIILLSLERISSQHLDSRLTKKRNKLLSSLTEGEIDSLLKDKQSFTDYNRLKDEFIVLHEIKKPNRLDTVIRFTTEMREIEGDQETYRILNSKFFYQNKTYELELGETMTAIQPIKMTIRFYMLIVLFIAIIVTLITDYAFTAILLRPFYKIIDLKLNKVNDPSSYNDVNIETNTTDFVILDQSINSLMRKIGDLFLQEKQFIANVSHELLTPVSILSSRLENILMADNLPQEHEDKIVASLKTLGRLKVVINNLLLISQVENEQYLKMDQISIREELLNVCEELEDRISDKEITFENSIIENYNLTGNQALIHTLFFNIVNNAIKYNVIGGKITISDEFVSAVYTLKIQDTGMGMSKETIEKAFKRFERENSEKEGFGLGLAIVDTIAKFHQLKITINAEKGIGTAITIQFPQAN
jgi:signal transduction histidine kinase